MSLVETPRFIEQQGLHLKSTDLKSVSFRWKNSSPYGMTVVGQFTPDKNYYCHAVKYNVFVACFNKTLAMGQVGLFIGFTNNPAATGQNAAVGTAMVDAMDVNLDAYVNWNPRGWFLPKGKTVYVMNTVMGGNYTIVNPATGAWGFTNSVLPVFGLVELYMVELKPDQQGGLTMQTEGI